MLKYGHTFVGMAIPKIKATYSLDEPTVRKLEEIARKWETSKSQALTRLINQGAPQPDDAEVRRKLDALDRLQQSANLTPAAAAKWQRELRAMQRAWPSPRKQR